MSHDTTVAHRQVQITNSLGLHLRPADKFVKLALRYRSEIRVHYNGNQFNGKSILDLTTLAAECGTRLELEACGPDAVEALDALSDLVSAQFYEDEMEIRSRPNPTAEPGAMNVRNRPPADRSASAGPIGQMPRPGGSAGPRLGSDANHRNDGMPPSGTSISAPDLTPRLAPMHVLRGIAVSPGIAVGPILVLDPRGMDCHRARSLRRRSSANSSGWIKGWRPPAGGRRAEARGPIRLAPQYADILAAHAG